MKGIFLHSLVSRRLFFYNFLQLFDPDTVVFVFEATQQALHLRSIQENLITIFIHIVSAVCTVITEVKERANGYTLPPNHEHLIKSHYNHFYYYFLHWNNLYNKISIL